MEIKIDNDPKLCGIVESTLEMLVKSFCEACNVVLEQKDNDFFHRYYINVLTNFVCLSIENVIRDDAYEAKIRLVDEICAGLKYQLAHIHKLDTH